MLTENDRFNVALKFFQGLDLIAARLPGNETVQKVADFLRTASQLVFVKADGKFYRGKPLRKSYTEDPKRHIWVFPYNSDDVNILKPDCLEVLRIREQTQAGMYLHQNTFMCFNTNRELSSFFRGLVTLHEGFHAWAHQVRILGQSELGLPHEYETHCQEQEWMIQYCGDRYLAVLNRLEEAILFINNVDPYTLSSRFFLPYYPNEIDDFMGDPADEQEKTNRLSIICRHAVFRIKQRLGLPPKELHAALAPFIM